jgi:hypothetical protein
MQTTERETKATLAVSEGIDIEDADEIGSVVSDTIEKAKNEKFTESYYLKQREIARVAITNRQSSISEREYQIEVDDEWEQYGSNNTRSIYENNTIVDTWCGDTKISRFWYNTNAHEIDGTRKTKCYVNSPYSTSLWNSEYYVLGKDQYKEYNIPLSARCTSREYGRVFFDTVTYYVPKDVCTRPKYKVNKVRGYIRKGKNKLYQVKSKYTNPDKGKIYTTSDKGILKKLTPAGKIAEKILWNVLVERDSYYPTKQGEKALEFYDQVKKNHFDLQEWALSTKRIYPEYTDFFVEAHYTRFYEKNKELEDDIDRVLAISKTCTPHCNKIISVWRARYNRKLKAANIIRKNWNSYALRNIGKTRTIF